PLKLRGAGVAGGSPYCATAATTSTSWLVTSLPAGFAAREKQRTFPVQDAAELFRGDPSVRLGSSEARPPTPQLVQWDGRWQVTPPGQRQRVPARSTREVAVMLAPRQPGGRPMPSP